MPFLMLSRSLLLIAALLPALSSAASSAATTDSNIDSDADADVLFQTLSALDAAVFDAFNHCSSAEQLRRHARYFAADVEFYHDNGGVTWSRDAMLANTAAHACGRFSRELIQGTFKVFPIKDFGAITQGEHRFCQFASGQCDGRADFVMVWRQRDGRWEITRVLSYGHRPSR